VVGDGNVGVPPAWSGTKKNVSKPNTKPVRLRCSTFEKMQGRDAIVCTIVEGGCRASAKLSLPPFCPEVANPFRS
jgi:hypothetical protein